MSGHDSKYFSTTKKGEIPELKDELNSQYKDKKKDAVKKVIAAMTVGKDVSSLFTDVVNCMQTENLELKKLVYLYLINYAKSQPDLAILAVNTFVKDSQDPNPLIRALAVRTMGCIRVDKITEYLCDPLQRCLKDDDPYVRKTASICVAKLYDINAELVEDRGFLETLKDLISDSNPMVVANAVAALAEIQENSSRMIFEITSHTLFKLLAALNECTEYNSPHTSMIQFEVLGELLQFAQDPNSKHLGTTVWDASMVFVKFLEKNRRKGQFSPSKLSGKRVIELGSGCGLAGFGMALLGCDVVATDQIEVLPLLMRNVERNTARIKQANAENPYSASFGSIQVSELDWGNQQHIAAVNPPFDYIVGTDIVYAEHLLEPLLKTILSLAGPRTTVLLGYELRSTIIHEKMNELWKSNFDVKRVPKTKMDAKYQHTNIDLFMMRPKNETDSTSMIVKSGEPVQTQSCSEVHYVSAEYLRNGTEETQTVSSEPILWNSLADIKPEFVLTKIAACVSKDSATCSSNDSVMCKEENIADRNHDRDCDQPPILCTKDADFESAVCSEDNSAETYEDSADDKQLDGIEAAALPLFGSNLNLDLKECDQWQLRRYGSLAARLLQNIQIP